VAAAVILTAGSWGIAAAGGGGKDRPTPLAAASATESATAWASASTAQNVVAADLATASAATGATVSTGPTGQANHAEAQPTSAPEPVDDSRVAVPDVLGRPLDPAAAALKQAGFDNIPYLYDCYSASPAGTVVRQDPAPGARAARTNPIHLYLEANDCATLPDVRGQRLDSAAAALRQAGATNIPYVYECLGSPDIGAVISQSPDPGTTQIATSPVRLELQANDC
jgi:serine/threonine-protein kinase